MKLPTDSHIIIENKLNNHQGCISQLTIGIYHKDVKLRTAYIMPYLLFSDNYSTKYVITNNNNADSKNFIIYHRDDIDNIMAMIKYEPKLVIQKINLISKLNKLLYNIVHTEKLPITELTNHKRYVIRIRNNTESSTKGLSKRVIDRLNEIYKKVNH